MKTLDFLESKMATAVAGVLMGLSLVGGVCGIVWMERLVWGVVFISGTPIVLGALITLGKERCISFSLPVSLGMLAALVVGEPMTAAEIALIMALGELLEHSAVDRAKRGLQRLLNLRPLQGRRLTGDSEETVPIGEVRLGDILRVLPGETIPSDGQVVSGSGSVDQALLTGESMPVDKSVGDAVFAGTTNLNGSLDMRVTHAAEDSALQRLIHLVEESGRHQAPIQREADRWAQWLVPCSLLLALGGYVTLRLLGGGVDEALLRAVTVLVTFCPCGLVLATPTGIMAAIGNASRHGVIVKSGAALEALAKVDTICFDKTGTLTEGRPKVFRITSFGAATEAEILGLAAAVESRSGHPLAKAITAACPVRGNVENFRFHDGSGVEAEVEGRHILCGKRGFLERRNIPLPLVDPTGTTAVYLAADGVALGLIELQDKLREESASVLQESRGWQIDSVLLSGDSPAAVEKVVQGLALKEVYAGLLPEDKVGHVRRMRDEGRTVAMVGDGINDAPALKQAHVGVSMSGLGSDIATEAADISLMHDDLNSLPYLVRLAGKTLRCIRFNICLALGINAVAVVLGLLGVLTPLTGALVHNLGSIIVVLNASLLYNKRL